MTKYDRVSEMTSRKNSTQVQLPSRMKMQDRKNERWNYTNLPFASSPHHTIRSYHHSVIMVAYNGVATQPHKRHIMRSAQTTFSTNHTNSMFTFPSPIILSRTLLSGVSSPLAHGVSRNGTKPSSTRIRYHRHCKPCTSLLG
jgi:hypothetical protein